MTILVTNFRRRGGAQDCVTGFPGFFAVGSVGRVGDRLVMLLMVTVEVCER